MLRPSLAFPSTLAAALAAALVLAGSVRAEDAVIVNITGPLSGTVGDRVTYDVELINNSGRDLTKLQVIDYFDAGLHHDVSKSPIEFPQKGSWLDLPANTKRFVKLDFRLDEPGRQCHRVEVVDEKRAFLGGATECCQVAAKPAAAAPGAAAAAVAAGGGTPATATTSVAPAPLGPPAAAAISLDLAGPQTADAGTLVSYIVTVKNTGNAPSAPAVLDIAWGDGLAPDKASEDFSISGSRVWWNLPAVAAGATEVRQLLLLVQGPPGSYSDSPPARACVRTALTTPGLGPMGDEECLQIRFTQPRPRPKTPAEAGLRLAFADLDDPVRVGDATTLVCTVFNDGVAPSGPLNLVIDLPRGGRVVGDPRVRIEDGRLFFDAIDLAPGRQQSFEIAYKSVEAGRLTAGATLSGTGLDGRLERSCQTEFLGR